MTLQFGYQKKLYAFSSYLDQIKLCLWLIVILPRRNEIKSYFFPKSESGWNRYKQVSCSNILQFTDDLKAFSQKAMLTFKHNVRYDKTYIVSPSCSLNLIAEVKKKNILKGMCTFLLWSWTLNRGEWKMPCLC